PQTITSIMRLKERLNDAGYGRLWRSEHGYILRLGNAGEAFFSADRSSNVVGATAHWLLEVDEAQDVDKEKFAKEFRPMGSSTNATTVLFGTAWDDRTLLEETKQLNLELERKDGVRRHFQYDWQEVAKYNPDYLRYVEAERQRLGESHPLFQTQYCLRPLSGGGRFLSAMQRALLAGSHLRLPGPRTGETYVAAVDVAGEAEAAQDAALRAIEPCRDSTVITIARLDFARGDPVTHEPAIDIVEHYWRTGASHVELHGQLVALLREKWRCKRVVVDATGVGEGLASFLSAALGRSVVVPFKFTAQSKSALGFGLLAAINGARLRMYAGDDSAEYREFRRQMELARSNYRANQTMNFYVDAAEGHDDFLMSLALLVEAARYRLRQARGREHQPETVGKG
ncbi:MAG: hypothetical protein HY677_02335, partial [Chloroflexi bacterium]|nr:hypothetical protein [Chloroflexota bacterium]